MTARNANERKEEATGCILEGPIPQGNANSVGEKEGGSRIANQPKP